METRQRQCRS